MRTDAHMPGAVAGGGLGAAGWTLRPWVGLGLLGLLLGWSYWPVLHELITFWLRNQDYSVGGLVAPTAAVLVWQRRATLRDLPMRPAWTGAAWLVAAELLRVGGAWFGSSTAERYALVLAIVGCLLLAFGSQIVWRLRWVLAFCVLMIPLPARLHELVALPLQNLATTSAAFGLESLGFFVQQEGNVLLLGEQTRVAVAEACSGLRMLTAFVYVAAVLALTIERPMWQRVTVLLASVPIAVLSNSLRVIVTVLFLHFSPSEQLSESFHDLAGLAMMPVGLGLSVALLAFLHRLAPPEPKRAAQPGGRA